MIVAYDDSSKETAMKLMQMGFTVVHSNECTFFDSYIYQTNTANMLRSMIDHNENLFLLNISGLAAEDVAEILSSSMQSPLKTRFF